MATHCPVCQQTSLEELYAIQNVPVHSVVLLHDEAEARKFPKGNLTLQQCADCQFIFNSEFDPAMVKYAEGYEPTQSHSARFNSFHQSLADRLSEKFSLVSKTILEVGCGNGEFLHLLCANARNKGIGFDPSYVPENDLHAEDPHVKIFAREFKADQKDFDTDLLVCNMTLEHIPQPLEFLKMIRSAIGTSTTQVFFMVPDTKRILEEAAFWDLYYEHCVYFTADSLQAVFELAGFSVEEVESVYEGQYLALRARPGPEHKFAGSHNVQHKGYPQRFTDKIDFWNEQLKTFSHSNQSILLWGGGSKAVAFLNALESSGSVKAVVDINPRKANTCIAGTGHPIIAPESLLEFKPDVIILMNPIYRAEVQATLNAMGSTAKLISVLAEA